MGPLRARARGEKSVTLSGAFFRVFENQFRSLADRWCFSATGHVGPVFREGSAGAYVILRSHTMLWIERGEKSYNLSNIQKMATNLEVTRILLLNNPNQTQSHSNRARYSRT